VLDVRANTDFVHCTNCHEQDNQWRFGRHAGAVAVKKQNRALIGQNGQTADYQTIAKSTNTQ